MSLLTRTEGLVIGGLLAAAYYLQAAYYRLRLRLLPVDRDAIIAARHQRRPKLDAYRAWDVLCDIQAMAKSAGAKVFPVSGTLLGIFRNGRILEHDCDIDVGILNDDPAAGTFIDLIRKSPNCVSHTTERLQAGYRRLNPWLPELDKGIVFHKFEMRSAKHPQDSVVAVDVFVHFRSNGYVVHGVWNRLWVNSELELGPRPVSGLELLLPADVPKYLKENYGDFRVERKDFENAVDCPNCQYVLGWSAAYYLLKMQRLYLRAGWADRQAILHRQVGSVIGQLLNGGREAPDWQIESHIQFQMNERGA